MIVRFVCPKMKWEYDKLTKKSKRVCHCEYPCTESSCGRMFYLYPEKNLRAYPGTLRGTQECSAFGGISPTYRIALEKDAPIIVWDFHSLLIMVQMCFSFMLTDKDSDMRMCKHCNKAFIASRKGNEFCSQKCKNQFNVYKSREKKKKKPPDSY